MQHFNLTSLPLFVALACAGLISHAEIKPDNTTPKSAKALLNTSVNIAPDKNLVLQLDGDAIDLQTVTLSQNGLVFFEQTIQPGRFKINRIVPVSSKIPVFVRLIPKGQEEQQVELPLTPQERRSIYSKKTDIAKLTPSPAFTEKLLETPAKTPKDDIEFDSDFLRGKAFRNLDAVQIRNMGQAPAGRLLVDIFRNDLFIGKSEVLFKRIPNLNGTRPCLTQAQVQQLGINPNFYTNKAKAFIKDLNEGRLIPANATTSIDCMLLEDWVPGATAQYEPGELRLNISVAQAYITRQFRQSVSPELLTQGESAGFVNYNLNSFKSNYSNLNTNSTFLGLNAGFNAGAWQFRQSSFLAHANTTGNSFVTGETVAKRALIDMKANLAVGDTSTFSPVIGSTAFRGVRLSSEEGLMPEEERRYTPVIRGVARTNARVRIKQNNTVFFEQNVPPGPFEFNEINPVSTIGDLQVTVTESDGTEQNFSVPYSFTASKLNPGSWRYSVATGLYRNSGNAHGPGLLHAYVRYGLNNVLSPSAELLASQQYQNLGLQANVYNGLGNLSFNLLFSNLRGLAPQTGHSYTAYYQTNPWGSFSVFAGKGAQSMHYLTADAGLNYGNVASNAIGNFSSFKENRHLGLALGLDRYGYLSLSTSQSNSWNTSTTSQQTRLSYGVTVKQVGINLNFDHIANTGSLIASDTASISLNIPLSLAQSNGNVRAAYTKTEHQAATESVSYYSSVGENNRLNYSLSHSQQASAYSSSASLNYLHPWGYLGGSYTNGSDFQQTGLNAGGGLVLHSGGLILSPQLGETFGILEIPNGEGIEIIGGQNARVNQSGFGVIQYLTPYALNDIELNLNNAPLNIEIDNTVQKVAPVEGSIVRLKFNSTMGRPVLIHITRSEGESVPIGGSLLDEAEQVVGTIGQGSRALMRLKKDRGRLKVIWGDLPAQRCEFEYVLNAQTPTNANGFINLKVKCTKNGTALAVALAKE